LNFSVWLDLCPVRTPGPSSFEYSDEKFSFQLFYFDPKSMLFGKIEPFEHLIKRIFMN